MNPESPDRASTSAAARERASHPASARRSSKRDLIVNVFLRQQGQLTADDLVDLLHRDAQAGMLTAGTTADGSFSRATVYRTLQWMVEAGIARKIDQGAGRGRFEHSYRHPRHFHLICKTCSRSFEFLSSDIEALLEEVASARNFSARQSVLQIHGTCEACRTGRVAAAEGGAAELLLARDALRIAIATRGSGVEFYTRAARTALDPRARRMFEKLGDEKAAHLAALDARYRALLQADPQLESRPTFLFFKGAANGLFAAGADRLANGVEDRDAVMVAIRCERGSHGFFKRYGDTFEDRETRTLFLSCADADRAHLALLIREYRALIERQRRRRASARSPRRPRRQPAALR